MDNRDPWIYKTTDFGKTWTKISDGLPKGPLAYARVIAENPNRKGMLFAGTGNALYYTLNDGAGLEAVAGRAAARAGLLDRGAEAIPRPGALHLRPRLLHHGRHHAAGAGRDGGAGGGRDREAGGAASGVPHGARRARARELLAQRAAPRARSNSRSLDAKGALVRKLPERHGPGGPQPRRLGYALRAAAHGGAAHHAAGKSAHLGRAALSEFPERGRSRTGAWRRPKWGRSPRPGITRSR